MIFSALIQTCEWEPKGRKTCQQEKKDLNFLSIFATQNVHQELLLKRMLAIDPSERPTFRELLEIFANPSIWIPDKESVNFWLFIIYREFIDSHD